MFALNCRFQIAAILILFVIGVDYVQNPHLKLRSSKFFKLLLGSMALNLCLDMGTVYTITHMDSVSPSVNRLLHQFFIFSVILVLFLTYLYIRMLADPQNRIRSKKLWVLLVPVGIAVLEIINGKLYYYNDGTAAYSYGPMVITVYACGFIYTVLGIRAAFHREGILSKKQKSSVALGTILWFVILLVQMCFPYLLLSGLGFSLMLLAIYFSYENQRENYDAETESFNRSAFNKMLAEKYPRKKQLYVVSLSCENLDRINRIAGRDKGLEAMRYLKSAFEKYTGEDIYRTRAQVLSILVTKDIRQEMEKLHCLELELGKEEYHDARLICHISVMDIKKYTASWQEVDELLNFMDAKLQHSACKICFLNEQVIEEKKRRDQIDKLLDEAISGDGFEMVYQPIYNTKEKAITSAEALVRLKNCGDLGFVSPEEFIPIAEEKGLIQDIGDRTLELVAAFAKENRLDQSSIQYIEVNLSAIQAVVPHLDQRLKKILDWYGLPANFINLEITETATINFGASFEQNISSLRRMGFSFSMDDFGTGYSNLAQINQIGYDLVKLDKSLIWPVFDKKVENKENAERLLRSAIELLKSIGKKIVAEGVETEEMVQYLIDHKVEYLQGYYFSKPIKGKEFLEFLKDFEEKTGTKA